MKSLADKSHANHSHPRWLTREDKDKVVQCKLQHPHLSSRKIAEALTQEGVVQIRYRAVTLPRSSQSPQRARFGSPLFVDKSFELNDMSQSEKVAYLLSLREQGMSVVAISQQYNAPRFLLLAVPI